LFFAAYVAAAGVGARADAASGCHASSGAHVTPLIELYTSEGCDSCPPAERWLSARLPPNDAHPAAIALAFHVDYWDRLGWVDRFARSQYTARQYAAMRANEASLVYTPQVLLQGRDFGWQRADKSALDAIARRTAAASIGFDATLREHEVVVQLRAQAAPAADAVVDVAYVDSGLVSDIGAGENRGARLVHDHVVRSLQRAGRIVGPAGLAATITVPQPQERGTHPMLVALVQRESSGDVLQAVALPLDTCTLR
jgi:hypothetical protein